MNKYKVFYVMHIDLYIDNNSNFIFQKSKSTILNITIYKKINEYFISTIKEKNNLKKDGTEKFI